MTRSNLTIDNLASRPEPADALARFSCGEWQSLYEQRGQTFTDALNIYRERTKIDSLPMALIALEGEELVGTVSLKSQDLEIRPEMRP